MANQISTTIKIVRVLKILHAGKSTIKEISNSTGYSQRSIYRLINDFEDAGISVDKKLARTAPDQRYFLAQDNCPFCNHRLNLKLK